MSSERIDVLGFGSIDLNNSNDLSQNMNINP